MALPETLPQIRFATPRLLPKASSLDGRVVVLDIAFAAASMGSRFEDVTLPFIEGLGSRLALWVDHHDHERHVDYQGDERFVLCTKAEHGACPEMITPRLVVKTGPVGTIVTHFDLDGIYAAAKWVMQGQEPYPGADDDARAVDTRLGTPSPTAVWIDKALRAHFRDESLKHAVVRYLVGGLREKVHKEAIDKAAANFDRMEGESQRLAAAYEMRGQVAFLDLRKERATYDKTALLLAGQARARVAMILDRGTVTLAAGFESGIDFLALLGIEGGMPTRVTLPERRAEEALGKVNAFLSTRPEAPR